MYKRQVLNCSDQEIGRILNTLGLRVQAGERFHNGDLVEGIFLDCPVRLQEFDEGGRTVLRVVIPDGKNRFPEDTNCEYPYTCLLYTSACIFLDENNRCKIHSVNPRACRTYPFIAAPLDEGPLK